jgi:hypothetical protein
MKTHFPALFQHATGVGIEDIKRKGEHLYSDTSAEFHGYDKTDFDYEHFDKATRVITSILRPTADQITNKVEWEVEIERYPCFQEPSRADARDATSEPPAEPESDEAPPTASRLAALHEDENRNKRERA